MVWYGTRWCAVILDWTLLVNLMVLYVMSKCIEVYITSIHFDVMLQGFSCEITG